VLLLLQADTRHPIPVNTPCSQPLCAGLRSSVARGIGSVTNITELTSDLYSSMMMLSPFTVYECGNFRGQR